MVLAHCATACPPFVTAISKTLFAANAVPVDDSSVIPKIAAAINFFILLPPDYMYIYQLSKPVNLSFG
jgi:hypothetical protein